MTKFQQLSRPTKTILVIQSIAMLMGTSTHLQWVIQNGFLAEKHNAPLPTMLFWDQVQKLGMILLSLFSFNVTCSFFLVKKRTKKRPLAEPAPLSPHL